MAAKGEDGSLAVLVARYSASNDVTDTGMTVLRIPYYDVANSAPTSHEVWMGCVAFTTSTVAKSILISVASEGDRVGKCQQ